jgi:ornithine decarboxylase
MLPVGLALVDQKVDRIVTIRRRPRKDFPRYVARRHRYGRVVRWDPALRSAAAFGLRWFDIQPATHRVSEKIQRFLLSRPDTPFLVLDLDLVAAKYNHLRASFPLLSIHYAVKANPASEILALLASMGGCFDVASRCELDLCLSVGVPPSRLSFGNTIKKATDIAYAYGQGVRQFVFDSEAEVRKLATHAPSAEVTCRFQAHCENAGWPLSRKFGCDPDMAVELLCLSHTLGLQAAGVSFHVGSQQTDPAQWRMPLLQSALLFARLAEARITLDTVNLGGGFPVPYDEEVPPLSEYARAIDQALDEAYGSSRPRLMLEPGRSLVGEAGMIQTEVVLVSRKSNSEDRRWVYLDVGKFGGLAETMDESIRYPLRTLRHGPCGPVILAGPKCDSVDILYEKHPYHLPLDLQCGDRIEILNAGAYTSSYSSVGFNGFSPLRTYCL